MKNTQSRIKPIETGWKIGTTYFLGCEDCTHNFKRQEIKMRNKVLREKLNCVICQSSKSRFLNKKRTTKNNSETT